MNFYFVCNYDRDSIYYLALTLALVQNCRLIVCASDLECISDPIHVFQSGSVRFLPGERVGKQLAILSNSSPACDSACNG